MDYPLHLTFKRLAIAQQLSVTDANGTLVWYVKQKAFKLKEAVTVHGDREQTRPLFEIHADRIIDFSARYVITDVVRHTELGAVQRRGMRSFWRTRYEIMVGGNLAFEFAEENPWTQLVDGFFGEIPIVGAFTGYLFHARYQLNRPAGAEVLRLEKKPAFFEGRFEIQKPGVLSEAEETVALLGVMMIVLQERRSG
jgi:uncharacterized protein YxjI